MRWLFAWCCLLELACAHRPPPVDCNVWPRVREGLPLAGTVRCDDDSLAVLRDQLSKTPETTQLVVTRSAQIPGRSHRLLCVDRAPAQACVASPAPGGKPGQVFVAVPASACVPARTIAELVKLSTLTDAELGRVHAELMAKGWFRSVDLMVGAPLEAAPRPLVVQVEFDEDAAVCRARRRAAPAAACPPQPSCQFGQRCVPRGDGCRLCDCEEQAVLPRELAELVAELARLLR